MGTNVYVCSAMMIAFGVLIPLAAAVWWIRTRKESVTTVLLGAATWLVFAMVLESVPKAILLNPSLAVGKAITGNAVLLTAVGALLAGLFEETGRFVVFKTLLRQRTNRETAVSHGIGHGGAEAVCTLAVTGVGNLVYAMLIRTGQFQALVDQAAATGADVSALESLPEKLTGILPSDVCLSAAERVFAMLIHVCLSVLVFYAVRNAKPMLYGLAVLLHALFDVPAALYQCGVLRNLYVCEAWVAMFAVVSFAAVYRFVYRKDVSAANAPATDG